MCYSYIEFCGRRARRLSCGGHATLVARSNMKTVTLRIIGCSQKSKALRCFIFPHWSFGHDGKIILQRFSCVPGYTFRRSCWLSSIYTQALTLGATLEHPAEECHCRGGTRACNAHQPTLAIEPTTSTLYAFFQEILGAEFSVFAREKRKFLRLIVHYSSKVRRLNRLIVRRSAMRLSLRLDTACVL